MFVTLYVIYCALAYLLGHLWSFASVLPPFSPFRLTIELEEGCTFITITYHPTTRQHVVVNIVMYICTLIVLLHAARFVLVGKKVPANRARSYHATLKQMNEAMETAQKEIEKARNDFKELQGITAVTVEALLESRIVRENARELHLALQEMLGDLGHYVNRRLFNALPINPARAR